MPVLKRTELIRRLDSASASVGQPVSLSGVITYYDWANNDCYLQDETGAIWIDTEAWELDLAAGDLVVVEGYTRSGYAPCVTHPRFAVIGRAHLPDKTPVGSPRLLKGIEDSQWVSVVGVVHALTRVDENAQADLRTVDGNRMDLVIRSSEQEPLPSQLQGARVQAQGVCASRVNSKRQLAGVYLLISHTNQIRILNSPRTDPFSLPVKPIASLMQFSAKEQEDERVHIQGSVTLLRQGKTLYVHDVGDGLRVETRAPVDFKPGEWVDVVGFPTTGGPTPLVRDAIARRLPASGGPASAATAVSAEEALSGKFDCDLVTIEATFLEQATGLADEVLLLQKGERVFEAFLEKGTGAHLPALRTGSLLRVTGICSVQVDDNQEPKSFHVLLRNPADVQVLKVPIGWMLRYAYRLVWILMLVSAAALAWIVLLRKKVREQTEIVRRRLVAEAALEARYRELVDNASEIIFTVDLTGKWTSINKAAERVLLYSKEEIRSIPPENLLVPEHPGQISNILERLRAGATPRTEELEILNRARRRITLEINARLLLKEGQPSGLDCIARDITERKQAEAALRESEERYRHLVESSNDWVWETDAEFNYTYASPHVRVLLGYEPEQVVGKKPFDFMALEEAERVGQAFSLIAAQRKPFRNFENRNQHRDGQVVVLETNGVPIVDGQGNLRGYRGMGRNITERKQAEEEKARLETQLRQAQKLEAIGTLAGGIAHDFNNILGIIIPYVELAKLESGSNGAVQESLSEVGKAAHRAKELVKQILTFSRQTHLERKPIRLQPVVSETLKMLRSALPTNLNILEHVDFEAPPVLSDSSQIHQVLMNLCSNASHAMRDRPGHIEVGLHAFETDPQFLLQHPDMQPGKYARLVVTDTGHGMDPSTLKRAFDPFFTTKAPGEGTGLGLAVVHGIVNDHKGYIYAQSRLGAGTRFDLFFPACAAPPVDSVQGPDQSEAARGQGEHILFVDDEPKLAKIASRVLERLGYRVTSFCCPLEALDDFRAHPESYDLVLTDLNMPGMMGIELAQKLLQIRPDVRILLATGFSGAWTSEEVKKLGLTDLICKPLTPAGLTEAIDAALNTVRAA